MIFFFYSSYISLHHIQVKTHLNISVASFEYLKNNTAWSLLMAKLQQWQKKKENKRIWSIPPYLCTFPANLTGGRLQRRQRMADLSCLSHVCLWLGLSPKNLAEFHFRVSWEHTSLFQPSLVMVLLKRGWVAIQLHASVCRHNSTVHQYSNIYRQLRSTVTAQHHSLLDFTRTRDLTVNSQNHTWTLDVLKPLHWLVHRGCFSNILYLHLQQAAWDNRPSN